MRYKQQNLGEDLRIPWQGMITMKPIKKNISMHRHQAPWHVSDDQPAMEEEEGNLPQLRNGDGLWTMIPPIDSLW